MANGHFTIDTVAGLPWWNDPDGNRLVPHGFTVNASGTVFNNTNFGGGGGYPINGQGLTVPHLSKLRDQYCFSSIRLWWIHDNIPHIDDAPFDGNNDPTRGAGKGDGQYTQDQLVTTLNACASTRTLAVITTLVGGHGYYLTGNQTGMNYNVVANPWSGLSYKDAWKANIDQLVAKAGTAFTQNPWIMVQPLVEPGPYDGTAGPGGVALWVSEHQFCIDYLRQKGFQGWIVPAGIGGGRDRGRPDTPWSAAATQSVVALHKANGWGALSDPLNRLAKSMESYGWGGGPNRVWRRQQVNDALTANFAAHQVPIINTDWDFQGADGWPAPDYFVGNGTGPGSGGWSNDHAAAEAWLLEVRDNFPNVGLQQWHANAGQAYGSADVTTTSGPNPQGDWANVNTGATNLTPIISAFRQIALDEGTNHAVGVLPTCPIDSVATHCEGSTFTFQIPIQSDETVSKVSGIGTLSSSGFWSVPATTGLGVQSLTYSLTNSAGSVTCSINVDIIDCNTGSNDGQHTTHIIG